MQQAKRRTESRKSKYLPEKCLKWCAVRQNICPMAIGALQQDRTNRKIRWQFSVAQMPPNVGKDYNDATCLDNDPLN